MGCDATQILLRPLTSPTSCYSRSDHSHSLCGLTSERSTGMHRVELTWMYGILCMTHQGCM